MGRKKRLKKEIDSIERAIVEHKRKAGLYGGKDYALKEYWEKEIERLKKRKEEREDKLKEIKD